MRYRKERKAWVHPRACGGTGETLLFLRRFQGASPRLRGNQENMHNKRHGRGCIPAPAGEPNIVKIYLPKHGVHPRACGGTRYCLVSVSLA